MEKSLLLLGTILIIFSGITYTLERVIYYLHWYLWMGKQMMEVPIPGKNMFVYLFFLMGIVFYILSFISTKKKLH